MWRKSTREGFLVAETAAAIPFEEADPIFSPVIRGDMGGRVRPVGINITVAGTNVACPLQFEYSLDGENWTGLTEIEANVDLAATGVFLASADFTLVSAPYWRLRLTPGADAGDVGRVIFMYAKN